jgi:tRNA dimethylallyltransferase
VNDNDPSVPPEPLLLIVGPTASGKSRLGLEVAEALGGEIVSADAFAVYRGMDIGTDKPGLEARRRVRHHLIDVVDPTEVFSAGAFVEAASAAIADIRARGATPVVVGGTHFWIHALLYGLFPSPPREPELVAELDRKWQREPIATFHRLERVDPVAAEKIGPRDRQRILRALEVFEATGTPISEHWEAHRKGRFFDPVMLAPERPRGELYAKIDSRVDVMFDSGLREEVGRILAAGVPRDAHALKAIGYRQLVRFHNGECDLESAIHDTKAASRHLAKRQLTWLRGLTDGAPRWIPPAEDGGTETALCAWLEELRGSSRNE